jgi:hypothetical protein
MPRVFHKPRNLDEFFAEARRHSLSDLIVGRHGMLLKHRLTYGLAQEPVYSVRNVIETQNRKLSYGLVPHIIPVSRSFVDLPQCKSSIDEFVGLVKAAREKLFRTEISTRENQNFTLLMEYPHIVRELDEYRRRLDLAIVEQAV